MFRIDPAGGQLSFELATDFEAPADSDADNVYDVELQVQDSQGNSSRQMISVEVTNENEAPLFTSNLTATIAENNVQVLTISAIDPDGDAVQYNVSGGADSALFTIDPVRGFLRFASAPDFDLPGDADGDNTYVVEVSADDLNGISAQANVTVRVTDVSRLVPSTHFPTPNANLGGVTDTIVRGSLTDFEDAIVQFDDVAFVDVNGVPATLSQTLAGNWSGAVSIAEGDSQLVVDALSADGQVQSRDYPVQNEALLIFPDLIEIGPDPDTLLIGDAAGFGSILSLNLQNGMLTTAVAMGTGAGPDILIPQDEVFDSATDLLYLLDLAHLAVISVDLASGDRADVSSASRGAGPLFQNPLSIASDNAANRILVVDAALNALVSVDVATGDRTIVSDGVTGVGPTMQLPTAVVIDAPNNRALVADAILEAILSIDLSSGNRAILADNATGADLDYPYALELDGTANRLLVLDLNRLAITSIDLASGSETMISSAITGGGPEFVSPLAMAFDASREQVFVVDFDLNQLIAVDLASGDRSPYVHSSTGNGPALEQPWASAFDEIGERILSVHGQGGEAGLLSIDLNSGHRTAVSDALQGSGPQFDTPVAVAIDPATNVAWVADDGLDSIVAVDLDTGDRAVLSGSGVGSGPDITAPVSAEFDANNQRILVIDDALAALVAIDAANGSRSVVSGTAVGAGPGMLAPTTMLLDSANNRAIVVDAGADRLLAVDLTSGNRVAIQDWTAGTDQCDGTPTAIALDASRNRVLASVFQDPALLCWFDLGDGSRTPMTGAASLSSPPVLNAVSVHLETARDRAFLVDADIEGAMVVDLQSGLRAVSSR